VLIVSADLPEEVNVSDKAFDVPSVTLPKARVLALSVSVGTVAAVPVPESATVEVVPVDELLTIVSLPVTAPAVLGANVMGTTNVCPGASVVGNAPDIPENPVPVIAPEVIVTAEVPDEVNVSDNALDDPSATLPKASVLALSVSFGAAAAVPVPESVTVKVVPVEELLPIVNLPATAPAVLGANVTGIANVCPGLKVLGKVPAAMVNPVPLTAAELIVTAEVPDEVNVSDSALDDPSVTLPKASVLALSASPGAAAAIPVPESAIVEVAPVDELLLIVNLPVTAPAVLGANVTGIASVCPGFKVFGKVPAAMENPVPLIAAELIVTAELPGEVNVSDNALDVPSATLPKARLLPLMPRAGVTATPAGTISQILKLY
jgi:hypothetical protein